MALYNIYAGLRNRNDDIELRYQEFDTLEEAMNSAHKLAITLYEFCTGYYWEDCWEELNHDKSAIQYTDEEVTRYYDNKINEKMNYYAILTSNDPKRPFN